MSRSTDVRLAVIVAVTAVTALLQGCGPASAPTPAAGPRNATPASVQSPPVATPASCRVPLWLYDRQTNVGTGYFLQVPGFDVTAVSPPATSHYSFGAYASSAHRWISVPPRQVAPDGAYYAYNEGTGPPEVDRVHVVDLATGVDRVIAEGDPSTGYEAFEVGADGIYASRPLNGPTTPPGLWRLDPRTGAATRLDAIRIWQFVDGGYAYTSVPNQADPVAEQGGTVADTLLRLDLRTGTIAQLYRDRGMFVEVLGFDSAHHPILVVGEARAGLSLLTGPGTVEPIVAGGLKL